MPRLLKNKYVGVILIVGALFFTYRHFAANSANNAQGHFGQAMPVSVAQVIERDVQKWNEFSGRLVAREHVEIRPRIAGTIDAIHYKSGALINKGDLLFTIDPRPFEAEYSKAQGAFSSAQAQLTLTTSEFERAQRLIKDKVISQSEYDTRKNALNVNQALFKSAKAALETAKINLDYTQIRSPIQGIISRPEITVGNLVEPGTRILTTVVSHSPIYADFEIDEQAFLEYTKANKLNHQAINHIPVKMGLANESGTPHIGFIESFDNQLNSASGTIRVRAVFKNENGTLLPGLFARINLGEAAKANVLLITDRAVGTDQNKKFVLVVGDDNKVNYREVKLGPVVQGLRVVQSGLQKGEKIVVNGLQRARPGSEVIPEIVPMDTTASTTRPLKENA
ncbi:MAG: efflux RND transporter periplasmic adaptor subunit [Proteobacteria bacterium]|nr:efflux RND transporter periplasmic adaptor subunit [Pseudomonadota bacterium]